MAVNPINPLSINQINKINPVGGSESSVVQASETGETNFADFLNNALSQVNNLQNEAQVANQKFATGEIQDIHTVMIASQKAELALQYTLAIRNKIMDAYSEIMRMQV